MASSGTDFLVEEPNPTGHLVLRGKETKVRLVGVALPKVRAICMLHARRAICVYNVRDVTGHKAKRPQRDCTTRWSSPPQSQRAPDQLPRLCAVRAICVYASSAGLYHSLEQPPSKSKSARSTSPTLRHRRTARCPLRLESPHWRDWSSRYTADEDPGVSGARDA